MQASAGMYVHAALSGESGDRVKYAVGRIDPVLRHAGIVFYMLYCIVGSIL